MKTIVCENCGRSVTRPKGDEGRGRFCSNKCARAKQVMPSIETRFWRKVQIGGGCWEWQGSRSTNMGHGVIRNGPRGGSHQTGAHRVSWELHFGPIPEGLDVLHTCDNPPCVRPDHLYLGTQADNNRDRDLRGRHKALRGSANGRASMTEETVTEMRQRYAAGEGPLAIARALGVSYAAAYPAIKGKTWKHVA